MPKGGLLHVHSSSVGNANWLVKRAIADENCYIYMLDDGSILKGKMNIFSKGKAPKGYELMSSLAAQDPGFASKVTDMITLSLEDSLSPNPWIKFESCFERIERILQYAPILKDYYTQAFEDLVLDNIQIIELRTEASKITQLFDLDGKIYSSNEAIALHRNIAEKIREKSPDFMLKLIISDVRTINVSQQQKSLEDAFKLRSKYPDLIVGYDLVGSETTGHKTFYYLDNLLDDAHEFSQKYHTNLPYYFHAGESDWATNENLYDAILLQSKRIGHAFNLFHFPELIKKIKQQNICIEACPISNQILGYITDLRIHPAAGYLKTGLQCILSSDDPMIFRTSGLSYDFWEAIMAWNLDLSDIKQLCINSISYSSLDPLEKKKALLSWRKSWEIFIHETLIQLEKKSPYEQGNF
jgi:adenosine deaminase CECR1